MREIFWTTANEKNYVSQGRNDYLVRRRCTIAAKDLRRCSHAVSGLRRFGIGVCTTDNIDRFPVRFINLCGHEEHAY
jgi:hypothetical protein